MKFAFKIFTQQVFQYIVASSAVKLILKLNLYEEIYLFIVFELEPSKNKASDRLAVGGNI